MQECRPVGEEATGTDGEVRRGTRTTPTHPATGPQRGKPAQRKRRSTLTRRAAPGADIYQDIRPLRRRWKTWSPTSWSYSTFFPRPPTLRRIPVWTRGRTGGTGTNLPPQPNRRREVAVRQGGQRQRGQGFRVTDAARRRGRRRRGPRRGRRDRGRRGPAAGGGPRPVLSPAPGRGPSGQRWHDGPPACRSPQVGQRSTSATPGKRGSRRARAGARPPARPRPP